MPDATFNVRLGIVPLSLTIVGLRDARDHSSTYGNSNASCYAHVRYLAPSRPLLIAAFAAKFHTSSVMNADPEALSELRRGDLLHDFTHRAARPRSVLFWLRMRQELTDVVIDHVSPGHLAPS